MPDWERMGDLSERERLALRFVRERIEGRAGAPSYPEIGGAAGGAASASSGQALVRRLIEKGYLRKLEGRHRGLELVDPPRLAPVAVSDACRCLTVPIAGHIAAGSPIVPWEPDGEELALGKLFAALDVRVLKVRGDSMIEEFILDGDYVAVRPCARADTGAIVVAEIDGCHTLKVFRYLRGVPYLYPRNRKLEPIRLRAEDDPRLIGVFVSLLRIPKKVK